MSDENKMNNLDNQGPSSMMGGMNRSNAGRNNLPWVILAVIILLIVLGVALFRDRLFSDKQDGRTNQAQEQKSSGYQAVFLTNGQVYFGKLSDVSATYATLKDIYYLQVAPQPALQGSQSQVTSQQQQQLLLVKLGKELHGPVDEMKINRDQILFFEDIREDGTVMTKIREYQANPPADDAQQTQTQTQTPATTPTTPTTSTK